MSQRLDRCKTIIIIGFRINNYKVRKVFLLINNLIILLPYFNIEIEIINGNIIDRFYIIIHREFKGLTIFLEYNLMAFYLDWIFFSRRPISRALV